MSDREHRAPREVETALVVVAQDPRRVLEEIGRLRVLDGWTLEPLAAQEISDTYYDAADRRLGRKRIGLRLRRVDGDALLTLKSETGRRGDVSDRLELEAPWSEVALTDALRTLTRLDVDLSGDAPFADDPDATLSALGLAPVQHRMTHRERRLVRSAEGVALAELALDAVAFDRGRNPIRLFEVELEARAPGADLAGPAEALLGQFSELRPWPYGKLVTGLEAVRAAASGRLALAEDGALTPIALEQLEAELAG